MLGHHGQSVAPLSALAGDGFLDIQIADTDNDAIEDEGTSSVVVSEGGAHNVGTGVESDSPDRHVGWRWQVPLITQGSTINYATLRLVKETTQFATICFTMFGEAADDPDVFTAGAGDLLSDRPKTTASLGVFDNVNENDDDPRDFDVTAIIQELVDRAGWAADQHMVLLAHGDDTASFTAKLFHNYSTDPAKSARLIIGYTASVGGGAPAARPGFMTLLGV